MAKPSGKSQRLSLYNNGLNLAMSFYIAPYRYFSYIYRHSYRCFPYIFPYIGGVLPIYVCFPIYNRDTDYWCFLIYIEETLFFLLYFAPEMCILYIQCFPYSKNNTFLSIHFFLFCLDCSVCFLIYRKYYHFFPHSYSICPIKICVLLYIQKKDAFSFVFSLYTQDSYLGCLDYQYFSYIYRNHFFSLAFPSPQYFCINAFIYIALSRLWYFSYIYENIAFLFLYILLQYSLQVFLYIYKH